MAGPVGAKMFQPHFNIVIFGRKREVRLVSSTLQARDV